MKITMEMTKVAYEIAKKINTGKLSRTEAKYEINKQTGMNTVSANAFITVFLGMMEGKVYKRAFNNETNKFLIESIRKDFGEDAFIKALNAAEEHTKYYLSVKGDSLTGLEQIIKQYKNKL